jgi:Type IV secretion system pilin
MRKLLLLLIAVIMVPLSIGHSYSAFSGPCPAWQTAWNNGCITNILWLDTEDLRSGNVNMNTIPAVIVSMITILLGIAGTVAIFSLIYHAVQMQINSGITGDSSGVDKAKKWMQWALIWFIIAISAWFLVTRAVDLLSAVS